MILGFSHLIQSVESATTYSNILEQRGYVKLWEDLQVPSSKHKLRFLRMQATSHDLVFLRGELNVELVSHNSGTAEGPSSYRHRMGSVVQMASICPERDSQALQAVLSFRSLAERKFVLESPVRNWSLQLELERVPASFGFPTLDTAGISSMALFSTNPSRDGKRLVEAGAREASDEFYVRVGDRDLRVLIARLAGGALVELISPKGRAE